MSVVDSEKVAIFLGAIALMLFSCLWILFFHRIVAFIFCKIINLILWRRNGSMSSYFRVKSVYLAPLGGKILFRNLQFSNKDYSLYVIDGIIVISWWNVLRNYDSKLNIRLHGLELLIYGNSGLYDKIVSNKQNIKEKKFQSMKKIFGWLSGKLTNGDAIKDSASNPEANEFLSMHTSPVDSNSKRRFRKVEEELPLESGFEDSDEEVQEEVEAVAQEELIQEESIQEDILHKEYTPPSSKNRKKLTGSEFYTFNGIMRWIGSIKFVVKKGSVLIGNYKTPSFAQIGWRTTSGKFFIDEVSGLNPENILQAKLDDLKFRLINNLENDTETLPHHLKFMEMDDVIMKSIATRYKELFNEELDPIPEFFHQHPSDSKLNHPTTNIKYPYGHKYPDPLDTHEVDQSTVFECSQVNILFAQHQSPVWSQNIYFEPPKMQLRIEFEKFSNNTILYGPWGDHQRVILQNFFLPKTYKDMERLVLEEGKLIGIEFIDIYVLFKHSCVWKIPFTRTPEREEEKKRGKGKQELFEVKFDGGSNIKIRNPLLRRNKATSIDVQIDFRNVSAITSNTKVLFGEAELFRGQLDMKYAAEWNGPKEFTWTWNFSKGTLYYLWEHTNFIQDFIRDWSNWEDAEPSLFEFIPSSYVYTFNFFDFHILMSANSHNIIDHHNDLEKNTYIDVKAPHFQVVFNLNFLKFNPETTQLDFDINFFPSKIDSQVTPNMTILLSKNHPLREHLQHEESTFLSGKKVCIHGTYIYCNKIRKDILDMFSLDIDINDVNGHINGCYIRIFINWFINYFSYNSKHLTSKEFEMNGFKNDKGRQIWLLQVTDEEGYRFLKNSIEYVVTLKLKKGQATLPLNLYSSSEAMPTVFAEEVLLEARYVPEYLDLTWTVSPITAEFPSSEPRNPQLRRKYIGCTGMTGWGKMPTGPAPDHNFYIMEMEFLFGSVNGEATPWECRDLFYTLKNLVKQFMTAFPPSPYDNVEPVYENREFIPSEVSKYRPLFVKLGIDSLQFLLNVEQDRLNIFLEKGFTLEYSSLNDQKTNSRMFLEVPQIDVEFLVANSVKVQKNEENISCKSVCRFTSGVFLRKHFRNPTVLQDYELQQEFLEKNGASEIVRCGLGERNLDLQNIEEDAFEIYQSSNDSTVREDISNVSDLFIEDQEYQDIEDNASYCDDESFASFESENSEEHKPSQSQHRKPSIETVSGKKIDLKEDVIKRIEEQLKEILKESESKAEEPEDDHNIFRDEKDRQFPVSSYSDYLRSVLLLLENTTVTSPLNYSSQNLLETPHISSSKDSIGLFAPFPTISKVDVSPKHIEEYHHVHTSSEVMASLEQHANDSLNAENIHERCSFTYYSLQFIDSIDVLITPHAVDTIGNIICILLSPLNRNVQSLCDDIDFGISPKKKPSKTSTLPEFPLQKITLACSIPAVKINVIQAIRSPSIINSALLKDTNVYSTKIVANDIFGSLSFSWKKDIVSDRISSQLQTVDSSFTMTSLRQVTQCLSKTKDIYHGISDYDLNSEVLKSLISMHPAIVSLNAEAISWNSMHKFGKDDANGQITCRSGKPLEFFTTQELPIIFFNLLELWKFSIEKQINRIKLLRDSQYKARLILLAGLAKVTGEEMDVPSGVNDLGDFVTNPDFQPIDAQSALLDVRNKIRLLGVREKELVLHWIRTSLSDNTSIKKLKQNVSFTHWSLIEDSTSSPTPHIQEQIKTSGIGFFDRRISTDFSLFVNKLAFSLHAQAPKSMKKSTGFIHNVNLWLQLALKTETFNRFSPSQFLSTGATAHQIKLRDVSLITNLKVGSIDVDLHPSAYVVITVIMGIILGLKLHSQLRKDDVKPKVAEALQWLNRNSTLEPSAPKTQPNRATLPLRSKHDSSPQIMKVENSFHGFFNLCVDNVEARAWMTRGINFAQLSFDKISIFLNKPIAINQTDRPSKLIQCAFAEVKKIHFEYNYAPLPSTYETVPDFISLFDTTVTNVKLHQFYFTNQKDDIASDNIYLLPEVGSFTTNIPYSDIWSASSLQLKFFILDWWEMVNKKPSVKVNTQFENEIDNTTPPLSEVDGVSPAASSATATLRFPNIYLTLDIHKIHLQFVLLPTLQMQYSISRIMLFINREPTCSSYRLHIFTNSIAFKSDLDEQFPEHIHPESKSANIFGSKATGASFSKLFILPEVMIHGSVTTNGGTPVITSNITVDYLENVIVGEIVNYIMSVQSNIVKEVNNIATLLQRRINKEEITERLKSELPKAQASVKKLNVHFDVNLQFDGLHFTVFSSASALIIDSGKIDIGLSRSSDGVKWNIDCKNAMAELVDLAGFKWSDKREFNGKYSSSKHCYKWLTFSTNIQVKNKVDEVLVTEENSTASRRLFVSIENTRFYMRPGSPQIGVLMFRDYQEAVRNLISELKESRKHLNTDIFKRLVETGEEYYTYYSEKIVKSVTSDPTLFIYSGLVRVTNTSLTIPLGDNPYFGFLHNTNPSFSPTAVIHVILSSVDVTTRTLTDPTGNRKARGIVVAKNGYVYIDNCTKNEIRNQSYIPTVAKFEDSSHKCHFPDAAAGIDFSIDGDIIHAKITSNVSGPLLSINPKILTHMFELKDDWISLSDLTNSSSSDIMDRFENMRSKAPKILKEGESTIPFLKQKLHISCRLKVNSGECRFHHTLNVPTQTDEKPIWTSISNKNITDPSVVAVATLPSFLIDVVHVSPTIFSITTSGTSTHLQFNVEWKGIRLDPKSVLFINEAWYTYTEFSKRRKRSERKMNAHIEYSQKGDSYSKPERWMLFVQSAISIQRVFRGYLTRKLIKEMKIRGEPFINKSNRETEKQSSTQVNVKSLNANSISILCRIQPFTISMTTAPISDVITSIEFSKPFDILFTRMHRHLHRKNEKGNALFNTIFLNSPDILIRTYNTLNPDEFMRLIITGVIANIGAGYGPLLRPDREATVSGTVSVENIKIKFNLPQINQLFLMYSLWMEKSSEAKKALANRISKVQVTSRMRRNANIKENELSLDSTIGKYGQVYIKKIEFASDLDYMIGKQQLEIFSVSFFIKDRGRYLNSASREPLHIGGYITRAKMNLTGKLRGTVDSFGMTIGLDHDFPVGGVNPTHRGKSNLRVKILPIELSIEYNMEKIINLYSESIFGQFKDVFDSVTGLKSHIQSKFSLETLILRLSSRAAPAFIKIFYSLLDTLKNRRNNALKVLQRSVFYYHHDAIISDKEIEKDIQTIKQLNVRSPIEQFKDLNILGHVTVFGSNLTIFLHDKFNLNEKHQLKEMEGRLRGDYTSFGVEEFQVKFVRNAEETPSSSLDYPQYNIQRNIQLFALKADIYHNTISSQPISLIRIPGGSVVMKSHQSNLEDLVTYTFSSRFPDAITVSTNFAEYKFLREILGYYQASVTKELSVRRGEPESSNFSFAETNAPASTQSERSAFAALLDQRFEGQIHFNPKLDVLGDMTPSVETVLGWLGIKDRSLVAKLTHMFVSNTLEGVLIGCKNASDGIVKILAEKTI